MPTPPEPTGSDLSDALDQVTKLNERVVETGTRVGNLYLDGCGKMVAAALGTGRKAGEQPLEAARTLVDAQIRSSIAPRSMWLWRARRIWTRSRRRAGAAARAFAAG